MFSVRINNDLEKNKQKFLKGQFALIKVVCFFALRTSLGMAECAERLNKLINKSENRPKTCFLKISKNEKLLARASG